MNPDEMSTPAGEPGASLFDVSTDAGGEGRGIVERSSRSEPAQESDGDGGPVKRPAEIEKEGLDAQPVGSESRVGPYTGQRTMDSASPCGLGDEDPGGQDFVRRLQVGRGKAEAPA